jgi:hypothetical protein
MSRNKALIAYSIGMIGFGVVFTPWVFSKIAKSDYMDNQGAVTSRGDYIQREVHKYSQATAATSLASVLAGLLPLLVFWEPER